MLLGEGRVCSPRCGISCSTHNPWPVHPHPHAVQGGYKPVSAAGRPLLRRARQDPSRTRQSLLTLATFRSWGIHWMTPHEGPSERLPDPAPGCEPSRPSSRDRSHRLGLAPGMGVPIYSFLVARGCRRVERLEDSPSGLWRTLGKRVGCKPSGVRIPHPPPPPRNPRDSGVLCFSPTDTTLERAVGRAADRYLPTQQVLVPHLVERASTSPVSS